MESYEPPQLLNPFCSPASRAKNPYLRWLAHGPQHLAAIHHIQQHCSLWYPDLQKGQGSYTHMCKQNSGLWDKYNLKAHPLWPLTPGIITRASYGRPRRMHCTDRWQGQMNNSATENSNTNTGDLSKGVRSGMKTNGKWIKGKSIWVERWVNLKAGGKTSF